MIITATISRRPLWERLLHLPNFGKAYRAFRREGGGVLASVYGAWVVIGTKVTVPLLLLLLSTGCASALVAAEGAIHRTIAVTQDTANAICDAKMRSAEDCRTFNVRLVPVIVSAKQFNRAIRENSAAEVPAMLSAIIALRDAVMLFFPPEMIEAIRARIESTYSLISELRK